MIHVNRVQHLQICSPFCVIIISAGANFFNNVIIIRSTNQIQQRIEITMKKNFTKIATTISAAALCAVPMLMNTMSASAFKFVQGSSIAGDANQDGSVDMSDVVTIRQFRINPSVAGQINIYTADVNGDGAVNEIDEKLVQKYVGGNFGSGYTNYNFRTFYRSVGDVNGDGTVDMSDVTSITRYVANQIKYPIKESRKIYADVNGDNTITGTDAYLIQRRLLDLPWTYTKQTTVFEKGSEIAGDANNNGSVDMSDVVAITAFLANPNPNSGSSYKKNKLNIYTADVNGDSYINSVDANLIQKYVGGNFGSGYTNYSFRSFYKYVGDVNGDNVVNNADADAVLRYIANNDKYPISNGRKIYADVNGDNAITGADASAIQRRASGLPWTY